MLDEFIKYLLSWVDKAIYVWCGQGTATNEDDIRKNETSKKNADRAIALYKKRVAQGINPVIKFDCSGLGVSFLLKNKLIKTDSTANTLFTRYCIRIQRNQVKRGDWVFKVNVSGVASHIGYIVDDELNVVESKGRDDGVVKRHISAGAWNAYGRPKMFKEEIEAKAPEEPVGAVGKIINCKVFCNRRALPSSDDSKSPIVGKAEVGLECFFNGKHNTNGDIWYHDSAGNWIHSKFVSVDASKLREM